MQVAFIRNVALISVFVTFVVQCLLEVEGTCSESSQRKVANILDDIEEFYNQKFSAECGVNQRLLMKVALNPNFLDFGSHPLSNPKQMEVTLKNLDSDHSFEIVATFGTHEAFIWSDFNQTLLSPFSTASFNVTFLPYKIGAFEGSIYISTSRGQLKYQAFGAGYVSADHLLPLVDMDYGPTGSVVASLHTYNPYPHHIQVDSVTLFVPPSKSKNSELQANNKTGSIFHVEQAEPLFLAPQQITNLVTFELPTRTTFCIALISYCYNVSCTSADCLTRSCFGDSLSASSVDALPQVSILPTRYTDESRLLSRTNLLHFGTVTQTTGPVTRPIELVNLLKHDITITRLEVDVLDSCLSLNLSTRTVPAESYTPLTVATLTVTPKYVSQSRVLTGFLTVITSIQAIMVKIPFYAKVIHGSLTIQERAIKHVGGPSQLRFDYAISNQADVTVSVVRPHFPSLNRGLTGVYRHPCLTFVQPRSEIVLFSLAIRNDSMQSRLSGNFLISTNVSTFELTFDIYSGHLEMSIENAHLVNGVYDFGTVLLNQQGSNTITLLNRNPMQLEIEAFYVTTIQNAEDAWQAVSAHNRHSFSCATMCLVFGVSETCVSCVTKVAPGQSSTLALFWGGLPEPATKTGFIVLKTTYQHLIQPFRFSVAEGRLSMLPNPMIVNDMFPGKIVRRNVIVQSSYSTPVELSRLQLEPASSIQSENVDSFAQLFRLPAADQLASGIQEKGFVLEPNRPTIVATVLFDPARACVDVLSAIEAETVVTSPQSSEFTETDHMPICHTGFSLDTAQGSRWLNSMTMQESNMNNDALYMFRYGMHRSATTYAKLRNAWIDQVIGQASSYPNAPTHSLESYLSLGTGKTKQHAVNESGGLFWADLSASLVWPRLVSASRRKQSAVKRSVSICAIRASTSGGVDSATDSDSTTLEQALRAHFPPTIPGHSTQCDLIVTNPSDRPLIVQPILLDAVYAIRSYDVDNGTAKTAPTWAMRHEPLVSFFHALGVQASTDHVSKLTQLLSGSFHVQVVNGSQTISSVYHERDAPACCPIFLLPPSVGQVVLRLTFTPDVLHSSSQHPSRFVVAHSSHNLLFLRNNLTALEPVWLNARLGKASLSLGMVNPSATANQRDLNVSGMTDESVPFTSKVEAINLLVRTEWNTTEIDNPAGTLDTRMSISPRPTGCWVSVPVSPKAAQTSSVDTSTAITLEFDFNERALWPFCAETSDPQLVYTFPDHIHSDLINPLTSTESAGRVLQTIGHRGEVLSSLSLRHRLVLVNSGDVMVELRAILLVPDGDLDDSLPALFRGGDLESGSRIKDFACFYRGFRVHPCFRYTPISAVTHQEQQNVHTTTSTTTTTTTTTTTNSDTGGNLSRNETIHLAPGEQFVLEIRYRPDFVYTGTSARLWIVAHPQNSPPPNQTIESMLGYCLGHRSVTTTATVVDHEVCAHLTSLYRLTDIRLNAIFPSGFLRLCLNALPRPWIEYWLRAVVMFLFIVNLLGVIFMGCLDASRLYTTHARARQRIDNLARPDPDRVFRFDRLLADPFAPMDTAPTVTVDQAVKSKCIPPSSVDSTVVSQKKDQFSVQNSRDAFIPASSTPQSTPVELPSKTKPPSRGQAVTSTPLSQRPTVTPETPVTKSSTERHLSAVSDVGKDDGIFSNSDDEPWLVSRSSTKLVVSKSQTTGASSSFLKLTNSAEDRKLSRSGRKSAASDFATCTTTTTDRNTPRVKKKLNHPSDDDRGSHSPTAADRPTEEPNDPQDESTSIVSPLRRTSRKPASSGSASTASHRSKVSDAPKTEAGIAAAVRATMRLAEETGSQARRKLTGATTSARQRDTAATTAGWNERREKRDRLSGGHSSTSSSSGPDHDGQPSGSLQPMGRSKQQQPQSQLLPTPQVPRASPITVAGKRTERNVFGTAVHVCPSERQSLLFTGVEQNTNYDNVHATYLERPRIPSDFQTTNVPHRVFGTSLDFDFHGDFIPDLGDTHFGPHLGLCWPASPVAFEQNHLLTNNTTNVRFARDPFVWPLPSAASVNHWDDAVAEVKATEIWRLSPTISELEPRTMDQIAADSLNFAKTMKNFSSGDKENNHHQNAAPCSSMGQLKHSDDRGTRFVAAESGTPVVSMRKPPTLSIAPPSPDLQEKRPQSDSDRFTIWGIPTSIIESLIDIDSQPSPPRDDFTGVSDESGNLDSFFSATCHLQTTTDDVTDQLSLAPGCLTSTLTNNDVNYCTTADASLEDFFRPNLSMSISHYFYELPQITLARRLSMLEYENRRDEISGADLATTMTTSTDWLDLKENDNDCQCSKDQKDCCTSTSPPRQHGSKRSRSLSSTTTTATTRPAVNCKQSTTVTGAVKAHRQPSVSGPPAFRTDLFDLDSTANTQCVPSQVHELPREIPFKPWQPVHSISKADLFMDLGLDDTDQLLAFGPNFSYHQDGTASDMDCTAPATQQIPATDPDGIVESQQFADSVEVGSNRTKQGQLLVIRENSLPRTTAN